MLVRAFAIVIHAVAEEMVVLAPFLAFDKLDCCLCYFDWEIDSLAFAISWNDAIRLQVGFGRHDGSRGVNLGCRCGGCIACERRALGSRRRCRE